MATRRPNWLFIIGFASCFLVPVVVWASPLDARLVAQVLGVAAFVVLGYQFANCWRETQTVGRLAVLLVAASLLLVAIAQQLLPEEADINLVTYLLLGHRWACLLFAVCYRRILGLGDRSPWVRPRETVDETVSRPRGATGDA